jgi:hypothetical protein
MEVAMAQQPQGKLEYVNAARRIEQAVPGDPDLGPLALLPGTWTNLRDPDDPAAGPFNGRGWNMIALPFATASGAGFNYRLLMNQYNERLIITTKDTGVPNRGIQPNPPGGAATMETDQQLVALDYEQGVVHIATEDSPLSTLKQPVGAAIHHEPGLFLFMKNQTEGGIDIARLGTIPHGNSLLALGSSEPPTAGPPVIPPFSGLPIGVGNNDPATSAYLAPYQHFIAAPFLNLFRPNQTHELLVAALASLGPIKRTTTLRFSTKIAKAGIVNIPFVVAQADATEMDVTFWILELEERGPDGQPRLVMMYHQVVMLDFFNRTDGSPGLIKWPHVSINTMERITEAPSAAPLTSAEITNEALG